MGLLLGMCGNGIRCVGKYVYDKVLTRKKQIDIETLSGIKKLKLDVEQDYVTNVEVDMGEPILEASKIPVISKSNEVINIPIKIKEKTFYLTCVSMGNPHGVIIVKNLNNINIKEYGAILEKHKIFPQKANIEFVQIIDKSNIKMRVWERGVGETLACGTGACAAFVASYINGYIDKECTVNLLGGNLSVKIDLASNHVYMIGPATTVFQGEWYEPIL